MKLAADGMKRTTMELGGHAPVIVFDDVDVENVLDLSAASKFRNSGQVCVSPTRYYVHEKIYQQFVDGFAARASSWTVGDGLVETNKMGPLAHSLRLNSMEELLTDAKKHGAHFDAGRIAHSRPRLFLGAHRTIGSAERSAHHERGAVRTRRDHQSVFRFRRRDQTSQSLALRLGRLRLHALQSNREFAGRSDSKPA